MEFLFGFRFEWSSKVVLSDRRGVRLDGGLGLLRLMTEEILSLTE
jgi:hypothetical protein